MRIQNYLGYQKFPTSKIWNWLYLDIIKMLRIRSCRVIPIFNALEWKHKTKVATRLILPNNQHEMFFNAIQVYPFQKFYMKVFDNWNIFDFSKRPTPHQKLPGSTLESKSFWKSLHGLSIPVIFLYFKIRFSGLFNHICC